jgi:small subunit ribosomal protein S11
MAETTPAPTRSRKKAKRQVANGQVHVLASFNNTVVTFTDSKGQVLTTASAGMAGFKGSRKSTAYAAQLASEKAADKVKDYGVKSVEVFVKGIGLGREAAIRALQNTDIYVTSIKDVTGVPHNGCRPRKIRKP